MYTDAEIRQKQQLSRAAGLSGAELLDDAEAVKRDCNGIGAAWMPDTTREWISSANPSLVVVADIHDRAVGMRADHGKRLLGVCGNRDHGWAPFRARRLTGRPQMRNFAPTA